MRADDPGPKADGRTRAKTTVTETETARVSAFDVGNLAIPGGFSVPLRGQLVDPQPGRRPHVPGDPAAGTGLRAQLRQPHAVGGQARRAHVCDKGCPDAAAHEKLLTDAAVDWLGATILGKPMTLPLKPLDALPTSAYGVPVRTLALSNAGPGRVQLLAGTPVEASALAPSTTAKTEVRQVAEPMAPTEGKKVCDINDIGDVAAYSIPLRRITLARFSR